MIHNVYIESVVDRVRFATALRDFHSVLAPTSAKLGLAEALAQTRESYLCSSITSEQLQKLRELVGNTAVLRVESIVTEEEKHEESAKKYNEAKKWYDSLPPPFRAHVDVLMQSCIPSAGT